ncbi:MAG: hypothetical protein U9O89_07915 [Thermoproteota archaeon]|nr:hypothetical protein [Thermoproteota archaeon]
MKRLEVEELSKVEDFLSSYASKATRKNYRNGIKKFEECFGKPIETLLSGKRQGRVIEKFFFFPTITANVANSRDNNEITVDGNSETP